MSTNPYNLSIPEFNQLLLGENIENIKSLSLTKSGNYGVVRYNKDILYVEHSYGVFRSIVIDSSNNVISFAPPKSLSTERFIELNPLKTDFIVAEEFVEGTMINVFWDSSINNWNISTRNTVGAAVFFYKTDASKTFNSMFFEALNQTNLVLNNLNKLFCYSFVLQHPENRIVVPISTPTLFLVQVFQIGQVDSSWLVNVVNMNEIRNQDVWKETTVKFPQIYEGWENFSELIDKYSSNNTSYDVLGVVIKNIWTNDRCKMRNPVYEEVRHLRGNQPKLLYHYLSLRKTGKIAEYLKFYPEYKKDFSKFRDQLHVFTNTLYSNYVSCYIKKERPLKEFNGQYKTHMFKIHKFYMDELKEQKKFVSNTVVINYVNNLHESQQMHALHYHLKKQFVDMVKSDSKV
jgi:hypothetical protein